MAIFAAEIDALIAEDVPYGDLTTEALGIGAAAGRIGCSLNKSPWTEPGRRSQSETVGVRLLGRLTLTRPPG